jgi:hypothetical protein
MKTLAILILAPLFLALSFAFIVSVVCFFMGHPSALVFAIGFFAAGHWLGELLKRLGSDPATWF